MFQSHLASKVEHHIVQNHFVRNKPHGHHFEGARCDRNLPKRSCRTSPHPEVECCTVLDYFFRKQQLHHHCGEAPYDAPWQKDSETKWIKFLIIIIIIIIIRYIYIYIIYIFLAIAAISWLQAILSWIQDALERSSWFLLTPDVSCFSIRMFLRA